MRHFDSEFLDYIGVPAFTLELDEVGDPRYSRINRAWCEMSGRAEADAIGKTAKEIYGGRHGRCAFERQQSVARSGNSLTHEAMLPWSGQLRSVRMIMNPILDDAGRVIRIVGVSLDRTDEVKAVEIQANVAIAKTEIDDFIAFHAHNLGAPMRNVKCIADLLRKDFVDRGDGKIELINILEKVANKATSLIADIMSHVQASSTAPQRTRFDLAELASMLFADLDSLGVHRLDAQSQWISADKAAIQVVLRNLCDNAIRHSGKDVIKLSISVVAPSPGMLEFEVRDNGFGFADPATAFLDGGRLRVDSGFGLLGIRRLVTARGGAVMAENLPRGGGGIVRFNLPGEMLEPVQVLAPTG